MVLQYPNTFTLKHSDSDLQKFTQILHSVKQLGQVLFAIDNAEDLITSDKVNFRSVVRLIILTCPNVKLIISSRVRLASLPECSEEISIVPELN